MPYLRLLALLIACTHNDVRLHIFSFKLLEVIILTPCVFLFVLYYDFVYVAWSYPRNVTTILAGVAALLF